MIILILTYVLQVNVLKSSLVLHLVTPNFHSYKITIEFKLTTNNDPMYSEKKNVILNSNENISHFCFLNVKSEIMLKNDINYN